MYKELRYDLLESGYRMEVIKNPEIRRFQDSLQQSLYFPGSFSPPLNVSPNYMEKRLQLFIEIKIINHIIFSGTSYYSFLEHGLM